MPVLICLRGIYQGETFPLDLDATPSNAFTIGRETQSHLRLKKKEVSRVHAKVIRRDNQYFLIDEKSHNNTSLDGEHIRGTGERLLVEGAKIVICGNEFEYRLRPENLGSGSYSTAVAKELSQSSADDVLEGQPAQILKLLLDLTTELTKLHEPKAIVARVASQLLEMYPKADRVLVFLESEPDPLFPAIVQYCEPKEAIEESGYSRTLVKQCLETGNALVGENQKDIEENWESDSIKATSIHSVLCAPLMAWEDQPIGVVQIDTRISSRHFTEEDLPLLMGVCRQTAASLEQAIVHQERQELGKVRQALEQAREIQQASLPQTYPIIPGYELAAYYESAQEVGGDYYDFIPLADGRFVILNGDVSGKALPAALFLSRIAISATYIVRAEPTLSAMIANLNRIVCEFGQGGRFMTMAAALLDPARHTVTLVNAGHNLPLVCSRNAGGYRKAMSVEETGLILGVDEDEDYPEITLTLAPGESVLFYSDGLSDAMNGDENPFGMEGVDRALTDTRYAPRALVDCLVEAVQSYSEGCDQFDDISIVCVGRELG